MNIIENNVDALNSIIFQNRNKSYGAYVLRSMYGNTILKSLSITIFIFACVSAVAMMLNRTADEEKKLDIGSNIIPSISTTIIDITPTVKPDVVLPKQKTANNSKTAEVSTNINDRTEEQKKEVVQSMDANHKDGTENKANDTDGNPDTGKNTGKPGTDEGIGKEIGADKNNLVMAPEVMPKFDNLPAFLKKNLRYPEMARELNIQGKVYISFVVDEEGKIINATVLKGIGYGCDEEALRVIKLAPKGTPGYMGNKPVKVSLVQAIDFRLQ